MMIIECFRLPLIFLSLKPLISSFPFSLGVSLSQKATMQCAKVRRMPQFRHSSNHVMFRGMTVAQVFSHILCFDSNPLLMDYSKGS